MTPPQREVLLTLSPAQHEELGEHVREIQKALGAQSVTAAILEACRRQATEAKVAATETRRAA